MKIENGRFMFLPTRFDTVQPKIGRFDSDPIHYRVTINVSAAAGESASLVVLTMRLGCL